MHMTGLRRELHTECVTVATLDNTSHESCRYAKNVTPFTAIGTMQASVPVVWSREAHLRAVLALLQSITDVAHDAQARWS